MKHGHIKLVVCVRVRHKWDTDGRWTPVQHVSDLKNIIFRLGHASDTTEYGSDMHRAQLIRVSDTARIKPEHNLILFFQLFDGPKNNSKVQKPKFI